MQESWQQHIGLLDRKLRVVGESTEGSGDWMDYTQTAHQNIYGYEWQSDSLFLAREALFVTFIEYYYKKFEPTKEEQQFIETMINPMQVRNNIN